MILKRFVPLILSAIVLLPAASNAANAPAPAASPASTVAIAYNISFLGVTFGHMDVNTSFAHDTYHAVSSFQTSGLISAFWQSKINATSTGLYKASLFQPSLYDSFYRQSEDKKQQLRLTFGPDGPTNLFADPPYKKNRYPVSDEQKKASIDPLSAVIYVTAGVSADAHNPCGVVAPVFDGRRRYDIELTYLHDEQVKLDSGLYEGPAHLCQLHYKQIAGFKPKILKEGETFPPIYTWLAEFPDKNVAKGRVLIPLKGWTKLSWGTLEANVTRYTIDSMTRVAKAR
jgi:hypothetical protein